MVVELLYVILRVTQPQPFPHTVDDLDEKRSIARSAVIYECKMETLKFGDNEGSCGQVVNTHVAAAKEIYTQE